MQSEPHLSAAFSGRCRAARRLARICAVSVAALTLALAAGCASTLTAKVTRFNQWPADARGATYRFTPAQPEKSLEVGVYEAQVGAALQGIGLRAAAPGQPARFEVRLMANMTDRERQFVEPVYRNEWTYVPPYRDAQGRLLGGYWVPDPFGPRYLGDRQYTRTVYLSRLSLTISETSTKRILFEATAQNEGADGDLVEVVPYLVRAMFKDFPGSNGQVLRLRYDMPPAP